MSENEVGTVAGASRQPGGVDEVDVDYSTFDEQDLSDLGALATQHGAGVGAYAGQLLAASSGEKGEGGLEHLIKEIPDQRQILLAVIRACREPLAADRIDEVVAQYTKYRRSVYTPQIVRSMLTKAGALVCVSSRPNPSDCDDYITVEEPADGCGPLSYRESDLLRDEAGNLVLPVDRETCTWVASPEALAYCDADDPLKELVDLIDKFPKYQEIYTNILLYCSEGDRTTPELDAFVEDDPHYEELLQHPQLFAGHFVGKLEQVGALEWRGAWHLTDTGRLYLER